MTERTRTDGRTNERGRRAGSGQGRLSLALLFPPVGRSVGRSGSRSMECVESLPREAGRPCPRPRRVGSRRDCVCVSGEWGSGALVRAGPGGVGGVVTHSLAATPCPPRPARRPPPCRVAPRWRASSARVCRVVRVEWGGRLRGCVAGGRPPSCPVSGLAPVLPAPRNHRAAAPAGRPDVLVGSLHATTAFPLGVVSGGSRASE